MYIFRHCQCNVKCQFLFILSATITITLLAYLKVIPKSYILNRYTTFVCSPDNGKIDQSNFYLKNVANDLTAIARHIVKAHRYSRHGKTIYELNEAYKTVQTLLDKTNSEKVNDILKLDHFEKEHSIVADNQKAYLNQGIQPEICPEVYMGMMHGYPFYYTGFITDYENCTGQPLGTVFSILVNAIHDVNFNNLEVLLKPLEAYYPNVTVYVAFVDSNIEQFRNYKNFVPVKFEKDKSAGDVWRTLAKQTSTKYIFLARQVLRFDNHTSFERILRFLSYGIAEAVGSSHRYPDGRWFRGCHATALRNYTLKFVDGYDLSFKSCIYCDYLTGPFAIKRDLFLEIADASLNQETLFVDLFTTMAQRSKVTMSCPDQMLEIVDRELHVLPKDDWLPFVKKWKLNRIIFTNRQELRFTCSESKLDCPWTGGLIMPVCCIQELADMMKFIAVTFEKLNIELELEGGSNVGAAKMYGIIPYERDADLDFDIRHHGTFAGLAGEFKKQGYTIAEDKNDYKCVNASGVNCGYFGVRNAHWRIEMWGVNYFGSDEAYRLGMKNKTRVNIDGHWYKSQYNPAESGRNQYGDDLFQHIEHWVTLGYSTGWVQPKTGNWLPCPKPGFHGCLNMYLPVGDIQFQDIYI